LYLRKFFWNKRNIIETGFRYTYMCNWGCTRTLRWKNQTTWRSKTNTHSQKHAQAKTSNDRCLTRRTLLRFPELSDIGFLNCSTFLFQPLALRIVFSKLFMLWKSVYWQILQSITLVTFGVLGNRPNII